jgi:NADH-quinone oxidoreductase subunit J
MIVHALAFYVFAIVAVLAGVMVVSARNPVHSVLFLILAFFNGAGLFVLLGAEFLAMILLIVYVGAVAVLFLFVVMMLDINFAELRAGFLRYLPIGLVIGLILLAELVIVAAGWVVLPEGRAPVAEAIGQQPEASNTAMLGRLLYTKYAYLFQAAGMILLAAMIGAIVLTLRSRPGVRRQSIPAQIGRPRAASIELRKVSPGEGA